MPGPWAALQGDAGIANELAGFVRALEARCGRWIGGGAGVAEGGGLRVTGIGRETLAGIGRAVQAVRQGERAAAAEGQRLAEGARMRTGPRMGA
ncbi:hypothetical protein [Palleronia aestuarii]|uniref:hypothetical protein n=1 Tax=Palleronia aestuarii TaxID=568105 RepID=UPI000DADB733|nr:hypothetical protein [Palleronia aestuarii]